MSCNHQERRRENKRWFGSGQHDAWQHSNHPPYGFNNQFYNSDPHNNNQQYYPNNQQFSQNHQHSNYYPAHNQPFNANSFGNAQGSQYDSRKRFRGANNMEEDKSTSKKDSGNHNSK
ncbi:hypothetical protein PGT21_036705 [Puccinia graminis f. sp. tritici]|uniref:Uncharacterized protein n=1 Tax=Puccinia graminis f. sp. tritici TaxID=56615 RepID=A0A5B0NT48_PUCGR|nr:hypothetical protein PGT21_036705 [Puccinia graminis f. sp. tritici]